jgi:hypothetical protein
VPTSGSVPPDANRRQSGAPAHRRPSRTPSTCQPAAALGECCSASLAGRSAADVLCRDRSGRDAPPTVTGLAVAMPSRTLYHRSLGWHAPALRRAVTGAATNWRGCAPRTSSDASVMEKRCPGL